MPSPLVVVRTYAVREFAASDHARLRAAGISAYIKAGDWPDRDVALTVEAGLLWVAGASAVFARTHRWHCHSCHRSY